MRSRRMTSLTDSAMEEEIWQRTNLAPREKRHLISARIGQGIFREHVERIEKACRVTGVLDRRHLRASHIKPWKVSGRSGEDRWSSMAYSFRPTSPIYLIAGTCHLSNDGRMLISDHLNPTVLRAWGLDKIRPPQLSDQNKVVYLEFHRQQPC